MLEYADLVQLAVVSFFTGLGLTIGQKLGAVLFDKIERKVKPREATKP